MYRGRFAPSPTGPLHLGSLIAAVASYLDARHHRGRWSVRMEDLDPPREEAGAADRILTSLERHGLIGDDAVLFQRHRADAYHAALQQLEGAGHLFSCACTRAALGPSGACNGTCRQHRPDNGTLCATRVRVPPKTCIEFTDTLQGVQSEALGAETPDFILQRKDTLIAYQLAVVVDDAFQGITHVVRGSDLMASTPRQIFLQQRLGLSRPAYTHVPVITTPQGQKFSKQNKSSPLDDDRAGCNLRLALRFLGQPSPPARLRHPIDLLAHAAQAWTRNAIPAVLSIPAATVGIKG